MRTSGIGILTAVVLAVDLVLPGCGSGSSSPAVRAAARGQQPKVVIHRDGLVGGHDHPWQVDLEISRDGQATDQGCGSMVVRKIRVANVSPGTKGPFDESWAPTSAVAEPSAGDVIVSDSGIVHGSPYAGYIVLHTGPAVVRVDALAGPHPEDVVDGMAPSDQWVILVFSTGGQERALRVTTRDGTTRQFFLRDAAGPCRPSPTDPPTPECGPGQYRVTVSGSPGAGSLAAVAQIDPVGLPTCALHADVTAQMRFTDGRPDGGPVSSRVDWLLPQTVSWAAGSDCFNHTEIFTARVGNTERSTTFPGGDCSGSPAGRTGSERHPLASTR